MEALDSLSAQFMSGYEDPNFVGMVGQQGPAMGMDTFIATHMLNQQSLDVLTSLPPDVQQTVMKAFSPKTADPGSYEINGKFIMFARSVQRGQKGGGKKGDKGKGKGWDMGKGGWGGDPWGGKGGGWGGDAWGGGGWGGDLGKGKGSFAWGGGKGKGDFGKGKPTGPMIPDDPNIDPPSHEELQKFCADWALNEDAKSVLLSLSPPTMHCVMREFKGGAPPGQVDGRFIVFARGVQKGRFTFKGNKGGGKGPY